jgi:hypothetical protein
LLARVSFDDACSLRSGAEGPPQRSSIPWPVLAIATVIAALSLLPPLGVFAPLAALVSVARWLQGPNVEPAKE